MPKRKAVIRSADTGHRDRDVHIEKARRTFAPIDKLEVRALVGNRAKLEERLLLTVT